MKEHSTGGVLTERPAAAPSMPAWARVADLVAVLLVVTAVAVQLFGKIHARPFGVRVSIGDPLRLLAWAGLLIVVRHAAIRRPPLAP